MPSIKNEGNKYSDAGSAQNTLSERPVRGTIKSGATQHRNLSATLNTPATPEKNNGYPHEDKGVKCDKTAAEPVQKNIPRIETLTVRAEQTPRGSNFNVQLFAKTTHNPSYASLTNNFENVNGLKDYCIPVNTYFPPEQIMDQLFDKIGWALKYYPSANESIAENIAQFSGITKPECIVAGNGSTEIISWLNSIFIKESIFVPVPSFGRWIEEPQGLGIDVRTIQHEDHQQQAINAEDYVQAVVESGARNAVICNPNNPTGTIFSRTDILWILEELSFLDNVIIDESFIDFSSTNPPSIKNDVDKFKNAWVLKSLGKNLGLHGLRMGYAISNEENIKRMKRHLPYWNVNGITEMLLSLIKNEQKAYDDSRQKTIADAQYLAKRFTEIKEFTVFPTHSNFIFVKLCESVDGEELRNRILQNGSCLIRNCGNKLGATKQYFRIAARPKEDVDYLIKVMKAQIAIMNIELNTFDLISITKEC